MPPLPKITARACAIAVIILAVFLPMASSPALADEKASGRDFAREMLWPIFSLFSFKEPINIMGAANILNFFAAFLLVYFLVGNLLSSSGVQAVLVSLLIVSYIGFFLVINWYDFFIDMSPAILVYFLVYDMVSMMATVTVRNVKLMALFAFGATYFFKPTREIFDSFFRGTFAWMTGPALVAMVFMIMVLRMASVVISAMHTSTALQARYSMRQAREAMIDKLLFEKYK